jgi:hypothetical protein
MSSKLLKHLTSQARPIVDTSGLLLYMKQLQDFWESGSEFVSFYEDTKLDTLILITEIAKLTLYSELTALAHFLAILDVPTEDRVWTCLAELRRSAFARLAGCRVSPDTAEPLQRFLRKAGVEVYPHGAKFQKDARSLFVVQTALRERVHKIMERLDNPLDRSQSKLSILTIENKNLREKISSLETVENENSKLKMTIEHLQKELDVLHSEASENAGLKDALKKARALVLDYEKVVNDLHLKLAEAEKPVQTINAFVQADVRLYDKATETVSVRLGLVKIPSVVFERRIVDNVYTQTSTIVSEAVAVQTESFAPTKVGGIRNFDLRVCRPDGGVLDDAKTLDGLDAEYALLLEKIDALNKKIKDLQTEFYRRTLQLEDIIVNLKKDNEAKTDVLMKLRQVEDKLPLRTLMPVTPVVEGSPSRMRSDAAKKRFFVKTPVIYKRRSVHKGMTRVATPLTNIFARLHGDATLRRDRMKTRQKFAKDRKEFDLLTKEVDKKYATNFSLDDTQLNQTYPVEQEHAQDSAGMFGWFTARQSHSRFFASSYSVAPDAPQDAEYAGFAVIGRSRVVFQVESRGSSRRNLSI